MERTALSTYPIAVFSSGNSRGSNLAAMHKFFMETSFSVKIAIAVFTNQECSALQLAKQLGIPTAVIPAKDMHFFETEAISLCKELDIRLIALAGFLKQLSAQFLTSVHIPVLNIHPALLPKYGGKGMYGMAVHNAVFNAGERVSGATVHLVDPVYDNGKIIAQSRVDISSCKTAEEIANQVLTAEHELYGHSIYNYLHYKEH